QSARSYPGPDGTADLRVGKVTVRKYVGTPRRGCTATPPCRSARGYARMHYLVVRTEVRQLTPEELAAAWAKGVPARDERVWPECRRQTAFAHNLESALHLARALATVGAVRAGR